MKSTWRTPARKAVIRGRKAAVHILALVAVQGLLMSACAVTRPVVKIGLVAPFEGRYRSVGYEVIYAVRLAVREANAAGGVAGFSVELTALDDSGDPALAIEQVQKLNADPQVVGALGHWLAATTQAAAPEYLRLGLPMLATGAGPLPAGTLRLWPAGPCQLSTPLGCVEALEDLRQRAADTVMVTGPAPLPADTPDPDFAARYRAISNGVEPGFEAVLAYDAARLLLDAVARAAAQNKTPTRNGVGAALAQSDFSGLSGPIRFDAAGQWVSPPARAYLWQAGELREP